MSDALPAETVIKAVNARMPNSVTPATRMEIHPSEWLTLTYEIERLRHEVSRLMGFMPEHDTRGTYRCTECGAFHLRLPDDVSGETKP